MVKTKTETETRRALSAESVQLINEIWELSGHVTGHNPTPEEMRTLTQGKDEYQLRKIALKLRDQWRGSPAKSTTQEDNSKEGGEGQYE